MIIIIIIKFDFAFTSTICKGFKSSWLDGSHYDMDVYGKKYPQDPTAQKKKKLKQDILQEDIAPTHQTEWPCGDQLPFCRMETGNCSEG